MGRALLVSVHPIARVALRFSDCASLSCCNVTAIIGKKDACKSNRRTNRKAEEQSETKHDSITSKERNGFGIAFGKTRKLIVKVAGLHSDFISVRLCSACRSFVQS